MRLVELKLPNRGEQSKWLEDRGWIEAGYGVYAQVYSNPSKPYVLKVFRDDDAYVAFLKVVLANQSNPHFPKVRGKLIRIPSGFAVRLEKLEPVTDDDDYAYEDAGMQVGTILEGYVKKQANLPTSNHAPLLNSIESYLSDKPRLKDALDLIAGLVKSFHFEVDIHDGNIMKRSDGTIVIIDPVIS